MLLNLVVALCIGFYGFLAAMIMNKASYESGIEPEFIRQALFLALFVIGIFRILLPAYKPMKRFLPSYYPISTFQKYI
ncbi:MAG: hypothetical protein H0X62_16130, partial [Bacteroidetes bacterium]|nr:hypothetical protein [Bacteroidota bacterium]